MRGATCHNVGMADPVINLDELAAQLQRDWDRHPEAQSVRSELAQRWDQALMNTGAAPTRRLKTAINTNWIPGQFERSLTRFRALTHTRH